MMVENYHICISHSKEHGYKMDGFLVVGMFILSIIIKCNPCTKRLGQPIFLPHWMYLVLSTG